MSECIQLNNSLFIQEYTYNDKEEFQKVVKVSNEENYKSLLMIWNRGINIKLIFKKIFIFRLNIGFMSFIDYKKLSNREKEMLDIYGFPRKFNGIFINDMRIATKYKHKGIGSQVVNMLLEKNNLYMLYPIEDGATFWKRFGFEYNKVGKYAVLDNR